MSQAMGIILLQLEIIAVSLCHKEGKFQNVLLCHFHKDLPFLEQEYMAMSSDEDTLVEIIFCSVLGRELLEELLYLIESNIFLLCLIHDYSGRLVDV